MFSIPLFVMAHIPNILNQLQHLLPLSEFQSFVGQHEADKWTKHFTTKDQLTSLLYSQARGKTSLRDIETGLRVQDNSWYHLGLSGISKSTLSRAMRNRPYEIFESLFYELLKKCQGLSFGTASPFTFKNNLYALDSTVIDLCLNLFPWAHFRKEKGALKLHTLFNIRSQIPELIIESDGKTHDIEAARLIDWDEYAKGSIFVADRAYIDYNWLYDIHSHEHIFVTRMKCNAQFVPTEDFPVTEPGVIRDQRIEFVLEKAEESYPESLRLIEYYDKENDKIYRFLTNDFDFSAKTIADIYKARWQIEIFFKWIKQHLKIKTFLGTTKNAVMTQVWVAMIYYLLLAWIKHQTRFKGSMLDLTRILGETLLQNIPLIDLIRLKPRSVSMVFARGSPNQASLF
jgi:hypothetical protein